MEKTQIFLSAPQMHLLLPAYECFGFTARNEDEDKLLTKTPQGGFGCRRGGDGAFAAAARQRRIPLASSLLRANSNGDVKGGGVAPSQQARQQLYSWTASIMLAIVVTPLVLAGVVRGCKLAGEKVNTSLVPPTI